MADLSTTEPQSSTQNGSLLSKPLLSVQSGGIEQDESAQIDVSITREVSESESKRNENLWLGWSDMRLSIQDSKSKQPFHILSGVSGQAFGGEVYGIIGASGGGKTTLLSLLSGRIGRIDSINTKCTTSGDIQLNQTIMSCRNLRNFDYLRKSIAFVLQEDILLPTELAREAIEVSALLRLPHSLSRDEKKRKAHQILQALDLVKCSETKIGGPTVRGLSGGERKRVSIGIELVTNPTVLMLDEPTSGLDSAIAYQTMLLLRKLANEGKMVIASLHQPSSEIFNTLDRVLILARGKAIYEGPVKKLAEYLSSIGYDCPRYTNVADFCLQKVSDNTDYFIEKWEQYLVNNTQVSAYKVKRKMSHQSSRTLNIERAGDPISAQKMAPLCLQLSVLIRRQFVIFKRDKMPTFVRFSQAIFTALLQGFLWYRLTSMDDIYVGTGPDGGSEMFTNQTNRFGGIFYATTFAAMNAIMVANATFPSQRLVFQKERVSNWYYTSFWIFAKSIVDLPVTFLIMLPFSVVIKFMVNFHAAFYEIFLVLSLVALVADSMGFCLGCVAKRPEIATQLTPVTIIPLFLFSNFFVSNSTIPKWIRWIQWIDCFYYGTEALAIWEFRGVKSSNDVNSGNDYLQHFLHMDVDNLWRDIYALIILFVGFRIIAIAWLLHKNGI